MTDKQAAKILDHAEANNLAQLRDNDGLTNATYAGEYLMDRHNVPEDEAFEHSLVWSMYRDKTEDRE